MEKSKHHIYIVDDDAVYRKSLERLLRVVGYFVESFSSTQSFLDSVPVDYMKGVLILDLRLPGMDGFALQKRMNELRSNLKIVFITAHPEPGDRDRAMESGAVGFLQKPFQDESLFELIDEALKENE